MRLSYSDKELQEIEQDRQAAMGPPVSDLCWCNNYMHISKSRYCKWRPNMPSAPTATVARQPQLDEQFKQGMIAMLELAEHDHRCLSLHSAFEGKCGGVCWQAPYRAAFERKWQCNKRVLNTNIPGLCTMTLGHESKCEQLTDCAWEGKIGKDGKHDCTNVFCALRP